MGNSVVAVVAGPGSWAPSCLHGRPLRECVVVACPRVPPCPVRRAVCLLYLQEGCTVGLLRDLLSQRLKHPSKQVCACGCSSAACDNRACAWVCAFLNTRRGRCGGAGGDLARACPVSVFQWSLQVCGCVPVRATSRGDLAQIRIANTVNRETIPADLDVMDITLMNIIYSVAATALTAVGIVPRVRTAARPSQEPCLCCARRRGCHGCCMFIVWAA